MQQIKILIVSLFLFGISGCEGGGFGAFYQSMT